MTFLNLGPFFYWRTQYYPMTSEINQYFTSFIWPVSCDVTIMETLNCDISNWEYDREMTLWTTHLKALLMTLGIDNKINFASNLWTWRRKLRKLYNIDFLRIILVKFLSIFLGVKAAFRISSVLNCSFMPPMASAVLYCARVQ